MRNVGCASVPVRTVSTVLLKSIGRPYSTRKRNAGLVHVPVRLCRFFLFSYIIGRISVLIVGVCEVHADSNGLLDVIASNTITERCDARSRRRILHGRSTLAATAVAAAPASAYRVIHGLDVTKAVFTRAIFQRSTSSTDITHTGKLLSGNDAYYTPSCGLLTTRRGPKPPPRRILHNVQNVVGISIEIPRSGMPIRSPSHENLCRRGLPSDAPLSIQL